MANDDVASELRAEIERLRLWLHKIETYAGIGEDRARIGLMATYALNGEPYATH